MATRPTAQAPLPSPEALAREMRALGDPRTGPQRAERFGITGATASSAFGTPMGAIRTIAKRLRGPARGRSPAHAAACHATAQALWKTGQYESRMLACFLAEPALVTGALMDRWARDFDNWAICDTACFHLFDKPPLCAWPDGLAHKKVVAWAGARDEFVRRAAFALIASLALHDKQARDEVFVGYFPLIQRCASDDRNFVKKAVSWALRGIGKRNAGLNRRASVLAGRLCEADAPPARWIGRDALRDLAE